VQISICAKHGEVHIFRDADQTVLYRMSFGSIVYLIYYIYDRIFQACYLNLKWPNAHAHHRLTFTSLCNMHHHIPALPTKVNPISTLSGLSAASTNNVLECPVTI